MLNKVCRYAEEHLCMQNMSKLEADVTQLQKTSLGVVSIS